MKRIPVVVVLASLSFGATALFVEYRRELARARLQASSGSRIAATACGPIEYGSEGEGPPVLVVHGAGGGFDQGLGFGRPLTEWGFRVVAPSRFGYLRTPLPRDASPESQGDAHACLLDALHLDRVAVMGGSAGAPSAMQLCLRHPERCSSMVLVVPLAFAEKAPGEASRSPSGMTLFLMDAMLRSDFGFWIASRFARDAMVGSILGTPPSDVAKADVDEQRRVSEILRRIEPVSWRAAGLRNDATVARTLTPFALERISARALVISVENDRYDTYRSARYTAARIPNARFAGYRDGGHVWAGHDAELIGEIGRFLREDLKSSAF